ncbi:MAG: hypothetical protein JNM30_13545 [Rhodospirillales bacterium]|nr:hypothetical protein [Rhodospirillales bacterium]
MISVQQLSPAKLNRRMPELSRRPGQRPVAGAFLDFFAEEPLPGAHSYWRHPNVPVTSHIAGELLPRTPAKPVVGAIRRHMVGKALSHICDSSRGF